MNLLALAVGLGGVVTLVDNQVLRAVVEAAREVAVQDVLGTVGVADLSIDRGTRHVGNHGVTTTPGVLGVAERVVLGSGLGEPDVTTVAAEVARLESLGDVLLDNNGTTGGVDEPRAYSVLSANCFIMGQSLGNSTYRASSWRSGPC